MNRRLEIMKAAVSESMVESEPFHKTGNTLRQSNSRREAKIAMRTRDVGIGLVDVAGRPSGLLDLRCLAGRAAR